MDAADPPLDDVNPKSLKVAELREALTARGLSTDGLKSDLVARLTAFQEVTENK